MEIEGMTIFVKSHLNLKTNETTIMHRFTRSDILLVW